MSKKDKPKKYQPDTGPEFTWSGKETVANAGLLLGALGLAFVAAGILARATRPEE